MERLKPWLVGLVMAGCVAYYVYDRAADRRVLKNGPVAEIPLQSSASESALQRAGYVIEPLASYDVRARVLSVERYRMGREADLSPVDFALGWGPMSDAAVLDRLSISQSNRWYQFRWEGSPPIDPTALTNQRSLNPEKKHKSSMPQGSNAASPPMVMSLAFASMKTGTLAAAPVIPLAKAMCQSV